MAVGIDQIDRVPRRAFLDGGVLHPDPVEMLGPRVQSFQAVH